VTCSQNYRRLQSPPESRSPLATVAYNARDKNMPIVKYCHRAICGRSMVADGQGESAYTLAVKTQKSAIDFLKLLTPNLVSKALE
jgi:hypothetical protein